MIGFYDYTVVLTYISLICSVFGITQAMNGRFRIAIVCLALSGLCDMFDGKIARTKKDRTNDERLFGVQIDSLCDVICFGVFPSILCYVLGVRGILGGAVISYYCVCSVIRLGFFNVLETNRQMTEDGSNKYYYGLPITSITIILPLVFLIHLFIPIETFRWILLITLFVVGTLFITNFRLKKPSNQLLYTFVLIVACAVIIFVVSFKHHKIHKPIHHSIFMEKILE
ncbi:CDP-alcohol phosphatidyltransferase family protein [Anaeromicropila herbilytica]|uniref:Phosphatidylserine synthase n=1 Tax=Anaeromicropila herbilytica TaxID=2785025 RepID=A0A7R7IBY6_9FIRM|nr:CDP-alcohol phosphatidyltransferase family protein [Anaeromicropila herbilytica]BCN29301.1 phosphatidylserine synthase [Anaeromicropila herbilytica]